MFDLVHNVITGEIDGVILKTTSSRHKTATQAMKAYIPNIPKGLTPNFQSISSPYPLLVCYVPNLIAITPDLPHIDKGLSCFTSLAPKPNCSLKIPGIVWALSLHLLFYIYLLYAFMECSTKSI